MSRFGALVAAVGVMPSAAGEDLFPTWTGAVNPATVGATNQTCNGWASSSTTVLRGNAGTAAENFFNSYGAGAACAGQSGLYCVEQ